MMAKEIEMTAHIKLDIATLLGKPAEKPVNGEDEKDGREGVCG